MFVMTGIFLSMLWASPAFCAGSYADSNQDAAEGFQLASPGADVFEPGRPHCEIDLLLLRSGLPTFRTIDLGKKGIELDSVFDLLSLTAIGRDLLILLKEEITAGRLKIKEMPQSMIELAKAEYRFAPKGAYVHEQKTYFYSNDNNIAALLSNIVHELTHAKDLWSNDKPSASVLELEYTAFRAQDHFFEQFLVAAPCLAQVLPGFPRNYDRAAIAKLYRL